MQKGWSMVGSGLSLNHLVRAPHNALHQRENYDRT